MRFTKLLCTAILFGMVLLAVPTLLLAAPVSATVNYVTTIPQTGTNPALNYINVTLSGSTSTSTLVVPSSGANYIVATALTAISSGKSITYNSSGGVITTFSITK